MNYLTLENVTKSYGEKVLFCNISPPTMGRGRSVGRKAFATLKGI